MENLTTYYSYNLARTESGKLVEVNYHDSGHVMGLHEPQPIKGMGHIKTRLYLWLTLSGLAGDKSIKDLIAARKAYLSCDGYEIVGGNYPIKQKTFEIGQAIHLDVYGGKPIRMYFA